MFGSNIALTYAKLMFKELIEHIEKTLSHIQHVGWNIMFTVHTICE